MAHALVACMHFEYLLATGGVGQADIDAPVEAARTEQRRIEHVSAVGRGEHEHARAALEAVHLDEDLVERLLALIGATAAAAVGGGARAADRVDLIDEYDARSLLARFLKESANATGADARIHLDKLGARGRDEGDAGLARSGAREERLAGAGRTLHDHALGHLRSQGSVLLWAVEKV